MHIPYAWCHSPLQALKNAQGVVLERGIINLPALFIVLMLSLLLARGTRESAFVNALIVVTKVAIVIMFIVLGWSFINPENHIPYIPPTGEYIDARGCRTTSAG